MKKSLRRILLVLPIALAAIWFIWNDSLPLAAPSELLHDQLAIQVDGRVPVFYVEEARTPKLQAKGLMYREALLPDHGMLFLFDVPRPIQMWMKDTLIPLDMLFIDASGRVIYIAEDCHPGSLTPIGPEGREVKAVLEVNAGIVALTGVQIGDQIIHGAFDS